MTDEPKRLDAPPRRNASGEAAQITGRALAGTVPWAGPALQELITEAFESPFRARMQNWFTDVASAIAELQAHGGCPSSEALAADERFLDVMVHATRAAQNTQREEKRRALKCAVMNSAGGRSPGEDLELRFIDIVDKSIPAHFDLLLHLRNPPRALALADRSWDSSMEQYEQGLPWGHSAEPPLEVYLHYMCEQLLQDLLKMWSTDIAQTRRLYGDLKSWQLLKLDVRGMAEGFVSALGDALLEYMGINEATAEAFERFGETNI